MAGQERFVFRPGAAITVDVIQGQAMRGGDQECG